MMSSVQIKCNQNSHKHAGEHTLHLVLSATVKESWPAKCTACQYACVSMRVAYSITVHSEKAIKTPSLLQLKLQCLSS